jgi:hypothetical protein
MMTNLSWSALIFAALAAVACWNAEDRPACDAIRPAFGAGPCCESHKTASRIAFGTVADLESVRRAEDLLDRRAEDR